MVLMNSVVAESREMKRASCRVASVSLRPGLWSRTNSARAQRGSSHCSHSGDKQVPLALINFLDKAKCSGPCNPSGHLVRSTPCELQQMGS